MKFFPGKYIAILLLFVAACRPDTLTTVVDEWEYFCNAETSNEKGTFLLDSINPSIRYRNIEALTSETSFSGNKSLKLTPEKQFGFTIGLKNIKKNEYFEVTAWRKSKDENGVIAASAGDYYTASNKVIDSLENGWEKLYLEFFIPTNITKSVKVYVWNNGPGTLFFDDFRITRKTEKAYPEYDLASSLKIFYGEKAQQKIETIRYNAFENGILIVTDDDYINSIVFTDNDFFESKMRLKGDWLDHIQGDKLSFRIKPKSGNAWRGMTEFSIQTPPTRNFQHEWVLHEMLLNNDLLTTRFGFVPVYVNGKSKGIYAWEEHFEKQLIESSNRREGPIIRFNESLAWEKVRLNQNKDTAFEVPFFESSAITPFNQNKTIQNQLLKSEFIEAQSLLHQVQFRKTEISEIFDTKRLAAYYAYNLLNQAYHGMAWHNIRYYYNPVLCRVEPITYDGGYEEEVTSPDHLYFGLIDSLVEKKTTTTNVFNFWPLRDPEYMAFFYNCMNKITSDTFLNRQFSLIQEQLTTDEKLIRQEFPLYNYDSSHIFNKAEEFRNWLPDLKKKVSDPAFYTLARKIQYAPTILSSNYYEELIGYQIHVYSGNDENGNTLLEVENYFGDTIKITGGKPTGEQFGFGFDQPMIAAPIEEPWLAEAFPVNGSYSEVTVEIPSAGKTITVPVFPWPAPKALSSRQKVERQVKFPQTEYYSVKGNTIEFSGEVKINSHVVIPKGYRVVFTPGTKIDITGSATFVSYSPLFINGTEEKPVTIESSDRSAKGFNVLQANERSVLKHVIFEGISNLSFGGWVTPSAVCFYESDVDMQLVTFKNNSNCDDALNVVRSNFNVDRCRFENAFADAFDSDFCTGTVTNCIFEKPGNDAIDFSGSQISISDCQITDAGDKGISGGENSQLDVTNTTIIGANMGVSAKDLSTVTLQDCHVEGCAYGMTAYVKKPEYGPATLIAEDCTFRKNLLLHLIEEESILKINNRTINGTARKLAERFY